MPDALSGSALVVNRLLHDHGSAYIGNYQLHEEMAAQLGKVGYGWSGIKDSEIILPSGVGIISFQLDIPHFLGELVQYSEVKWNNTAPFGWDYFKR